MTRKLLLILVLAVVGPAAIVAGCGGVPGNAVAQVDGDTIDKAAFDHWMNVAVKSSGQPGAVVPDPPDYERCVAEGRKQKPAEGQPKPSDAQLREQCERQYQTLRDQVMRLLIQFEWIEGEAAAQGIEVTDAEVQKSFEQQKKQNFPKEADYEKFLEDTGQTQEDILRRVRLDLLSTKLQEKITKGKDKVSDAEVKAYYDKNKERFAQPERRDLRVVLTETEAEAQQARQALESGGSWADVVKQYSIDDTSKPAQGRLPSVTQGQLEQALDEAVFDAGKGSLEGPVKTQFGYYIFEVEKIAEADQQSLDDAEQTIRQLLIAENQQKAMQTFVADFEKRWKEKTDCADDFKAPECSNAPEPTATPDAQATPTPAG